LGVFIAARVLLSSVFVGLGLECLLTAAGVPELAANLQPLAPWHSAA
jgi:hypothetical protein